MTSSAAAATAATRSPSTTMNPGTFATGCSGAGGGDVAARSALPPAAVASPIRTKARARVVTRDRGA